MDYGYALVTGGTGGIGTYIVKALSDIGYAVVANYHPDIPGAEKWEAEMKESGFNVSILAADVSDYDSCESMRSKFNERFGKISCLVNAAGITRDKVLKKMKPSQWDELIKVNLNSVFYVSRVFVNDMIEGGFGRIVNISSVNGHKGQFGQTNYSASKAGIYGFTKSLAYECAKNGITVNSVSPGYTNTKMMQTIPKEILDGIVSHIAVGRLAEPSEIARVVAFLAHPDSGYITGTDISVNGGLYMR